MHCRTYNWAAFQRSIAALYERRRMAQQYGCFAEVGLYYLPGEKWKQHDELFYKFGFDVPLPRFLQNEDRAAWLRMPAAELPEHHRATDTITFADRDAVDPELFIIKSLRALWSDGAARGVLHITFCGTCPKNRSWCPSTGWRTSKCGVNIRKQARVVSGCL